MQRDEREYIKRLEVIRWGGVPTCPYCDSQRSSSIEMGMRHHCNSCFTSYSVTVGTIFHKTHVDLRKWFRAVPLVLNSSKEISIRRLAQEIGVSKSTAAQMKKRICNAANKDSELIKAILLND